MKKEALAKFYAKYKAQIFPAIVALTSLFLIIFVIYPQIMKLLDNQKTMGTLIQKSKFLEAKAVALESYNEEDLSSKVEFVLNALPAEKDFGNILSLLQQLSAQSGFTIGELAFSSAGSKVGKAESLEVKLSIKGAKNGLQTFLNNLENLPRAVSISSIDVNSNRAAQTVDAFLTVEFLYSQMPKDFGSADSPLPELSQKDEDLITALARSGRLLVGTSSATVSPRGKSNPFD